MDLLWTPWRFAYVTAADRTTRPGVPPSLSAWPGDLGCVFCNLIASIDYAIANGMSAEEAEAAGGLILRGKALLCLPERLPLHLRPRDGDALRAPGPAGGAAASRRPMS